MRPGFLSKLKVTVGDRNVPALQLWIACNFVSMALILVLGMRLGWAFFASHASLSSLSLDFAWMALVSNLWLLAAIITVRLVMAWLAYHVLDGLRSSEAAARQVAGRDALSGLPNRFLFNALVDAEIARCKRGRHQFALFYLDLDHFKQANDTFGHDVGDRLIVAVTRRLADVLRSCDHFARLGGDEFALMQADVNEPRDCARLAQRILDAMSAPFDIGGQQIFIGISIGIALCPQNATDCQELMRLADLALYRSKQAGRNRFAFFEAKMGEELRMRQSAEDELRTAIENNELELLYQPIISSTDDKIICVEALARWRHKTYGLLSADSFIPLAEERGLIVQLGEWALRRACADAMRWPGIKVAINVSPIQFRQKDFVATVNRILTESGIDPQRVELELTEGVIIADADLAEHSMINLRALGVHMVLDDFGTGYSSLIYLRRFAFDKIKIDRSFLESMEDSGESVIIVRSIVDLGRSLGLRVTAEGVETEEQARLLRSIDCDELQGFLFARPMSVEDIDQRLEDENARELLPVSARSVA
ncbi:MAG TPA: EAL domain-containing protein [Methylovirgula sp.]